MRAPKNWQAAGATCQENYREGIPGFDVCGSHHRMSRLYDQPPARTRQYAPMIWHYAPIATFALAVCQPESKSIPVIRHLYGVRNVRESAQVQHY